MRLPATGIDARRMYEDVVERAMRHASRRVDRAEALEVAHDVACALVRRRVEGMDDPDDTRSFEGLIYRAVANRLANIKRSADRRAAVDRVHHDERAASPPMWSEADAAVEHEELSTVVEAVIAEMPGAMRAVFLLVRRDGLTYRDAAQRLGVGVGTIHTHLARANVRLRDALARYQAPSDNAVASRQQ